MNDAATDARPGLPHALGLRENLAQFMLLVLVNAFVGGMAGLERTILPVLAESEFHVAGRAALLSFIVAFGLSKAAVNLLAGYLADRVGRKAVLVAGWLLASPVPFLLMWAPSWNWILAANVLLGLSQGLTWSLTVIMKIDLVGPKGRGFAMGLNEFAGYLAVALSAWATGYLAAVYGPRPEPFLLGIAFVVLGLGLSVFVVRETREFAALEARQAPPGPKLGGSALRRFAYASVGDRNLAAANQAGLINNLNDGAAWGLFPLVFAAGGTSLGAIGALAALYPAVWGISQLVTGSLSDRFGRKWLIAGGMAVQAAGLGLIAAWPVMATFVAGSVLLGFGTAMVYPSLLAAVGDAAHASWRATAVGTYRFWRDSGYAVGAVLAGVACDALGLRPAIGIVAILTLASGIALSFMMIEGRSE